MTPPRGKELWTRLAAGATVADLGAGMIDGRIDLRGVELPEHDLGLILTVRWRDLDFSGSSLHALRLRNSIIENCKFDRADCQDWRIWGTDVARSTFVGTDLRRSSLGGVDGMARNRYRAVDFSKADMRKTAHWSADFLGCCFAGTNLKGVDFHGTVFEDCIFEGKLDGVHFHRSALDGDGLPVNEMKNVDFRRASLRSVEFRGLDLETVLMPEGNEHVIIHDYRVALRRAIAELESRSDIESRQLSAYLGVCLKWAGTNQERGVLHLGELQKASSAQAVAAFLHAL